jgi:hypothetical protein
MILYHCASIAEKTSPQLSLIREFVNFVTFSFIIVTGFLCGWYYVNKLDIVSQSSVIKRLIVRGLKIIIIFIFSNVILYIVGIFNRNRLSEATTTFADSCRNLLLSPNGDLIAFEILLPIGFFLMLAPLVIMRRHTLGMAVFFTVITIYLGKYIDILSTVTFGGIGLIAGCLFQAEWAKKILVSYKKNVMISLVFLFLFFCVIMSMRIFHFPLPYHLYFTLKTVLWFLGFLIIVKLTDNKFLSDSFEFLGNYTLLGYMSQMLIIRLIYLLLLKTGLRGYYYYITNVLISTILLFIFLKIIALLRNKIPFFNNTYRLIFQ